MQLREFAGFAQNAPYTPFEFECSLKGFDGTYAGPGNEYLQLHDTATTPAANAVPIRSWLLSAAGPLPSFSVSGEGSIHLFNGCTFAISTAEGGYTASANNFSIEGEIEDYQFRHNPLPIVLTAMVGDDTIDFWPDAIAQNTKHILDLEFTNGESAPVYAMLFAKSPVNGDRPLFVSPVISISGAAVKVSFGSSGFSLYSKDANHTEHYGCFLRMSLTPTTLTQSVEGNCNASGHYIIA